MPNKWLKVNTIRIPSEDLVLPERSKQEVFLIRVASLQFILIMQNRPERVTIISGMVTQPSQCGGTRTLLESLETVECSTRLTKVIKAGDSSWPCLLSLLL